MCLALQFTFKGVPGLYYGIEIPLEGGYDPDNRRPMNFDKIDNNSVYFKTIKELIKIAWKYLISALLIKLYNMVIFLLLLKKDY